MQPLPFQSAKKAQKTFAHRQKAAQRLQRFWVAKGQHLTTWQVVDKYLKIGPTIEHVRRISFEELVVFLRNKETIAITKACLQRLHLLCIRRHGCSGGGKGLEHNRLIPENVNVRVFMAGFMIAYRPTHVFESMGRLEQELYDAATPLLKRFDTMATCLQRKRHFAHVPTELTRDFQAQLIEYLIKFKAWKVPDEAKLVSRIKHALIALYQAREHLPPNEAEDSKLKIEFYTQIERLRTKLEQIGGKKELELFDEQRLQPLPTASCRGGGGSSGGEGGGGGGAGGGSVYSGYKVKRITNEQLAHELLLDPTFQLHDENGDDGSIASQYRTNPVFRGIRESFHRAFWNSLVDDLRLATPSYARLLRLLGEIRDGITDVACCHRGDDVHQVIDIEFIKGQAEAGLYDWGDCRQLVCAIVSIIQRVQAPKRDKETQAKWEEVSKTLSDATLPACVRQANANGPQALCKALEFLLNRVNAMRIDAANARLRLISPVIVDHGIDYERGKFQDKLNDGTLTLEHTRSWIERTLKREAAKEPSFVDGLLEGKVAVYVQLHSAAMLSLVTNQHYNVGVCPPINEDECPETLLFDVHRLHLLHEEFCAQGAAVTLLATLRHGLLMSSSPPCIQPKKKVAVCDDVLAAVAALLAKGEDRKLCMEEEEAKKKDDDNSDASNHCIDHTMMMMMLDNISAILAEKRAALEEGGVDLGALLRALKECADPLHAVHQLMTLRLSAYWGETFTKMIMMTKAKEEKKEEDNEATTTATSCVAADKSGGGTGTSGNSQTVLFLQIIAPLVPRIEKAVGKLAALAKLNRNVHLPTYNKVFEEVARAMLGADSK